MTIITSIRVFHETKDRLKSYGTMKDTMDDVLNRLMDYVDNPSLSSSNGRLMDKVDENTYGQPVYKFLKIDNFDDNKQPSDEDNLRSRELSKNYLIGGKQ